MKYLNVLLLALVAMLLMGPGWAQDYLNVTEAPYSAVPNDDNDDWDAIQDAINDACASDDTRIVYLPPGMYKISQTLVVTGAGTRDLKISGAGRSGYPYPNESTTRIVWDEEAADGGVMLKMNYNKGLRLSDLCLDGCENTVSAAKAGMLVKFENISAQPHLERVLFTDGVTGLYCTNENCNSDMTLNDVSFTYLNTGMHTAGGQNVNYLLNRVGLDNVAIGLRFEQGGSATCNHLYGSSVGTAIKIDGAQFSNGNYTFNGVKVETQIFQGHRTTLVNATAATSGVVNITGLCTMESGIFDDITTPLFIVGSGMQVRVSGSIISGCTLATLTGSTSKEPTWMTFEDCRFHTGPRPEEAITISTNAGYELRNCMYGWRKIPNVVKEVGISETLAPPTDVYVSTTAPDEVTNSSIKLRWTDSVDNDVVDDYYVQRAKFVDANGDGKNDITFTWTSYTVQKGVGYYNFTGLEANTTYILRVRARDGGAYALGKYLSVKTDP